MCTRSDVPAWRKPRCVNLAWDGFRPNLHDFVPMRLFERLPLENLKLTKGVSCIMTS